MTKSMCVAAVLLVAASTARTVLAANDEFARQGPYLGIGATAAFNLLDDAFKDALDPVPVRVKDAWGLNARAGYRFNEWISAEVEYEWVDDFKVKAAGLDLAELEAQTLTLNGRFIAPLGRFQPYLLLGIGGTFYNLHNTPFGFIGLDVENATPSGRLGAGADFYATKNLVLNLGVEAVVNDDKVKSIAGSGRGLNYLALQFGFGYHF
jgi:opacity protein-like surface antigen